MPRRRRPRQQLFNGPPNVYTELVCDGVQQLFSDSRPVWRAHDATEFGARFTGTREAFIKDLAQSPIPVYHIEDVGTSEKATGFDFVRLERRTSVLPYPHRHDYYQIVWVVAGSGFHVIDSVPYPVRKDSVFFISPRQIHDFQLSGEMTGYTLNFSAEFFFFGQKDRSSMTDFVFFSSENPVQVLYLSPEQSAVMKKDIESIEEEYCGKLPRHRDVIRSYLHIFLLKARRFSNVAEVAGSAHRSFFLTQRFKVLLETEPLMLGPIRRYAEKLHVTERYLSDAVRMATGLTTTELVHERVVLEAKRMLAHSDLNITSIAIHLGFEDPAYFSRFFKKYVGQSPRDFKRRTMSSGATHAEHGTKSN